MLTCVHISINGGFGLYLSPSDWSYVVKVRHACRVHASWLLPARIWDIFWNSIVRAVHPNHSLHLMINVGFIAFKENALPGRGHVILLSWSFCLSLTTWINQGKHLPNLSVETNIVCCSVIYSSSLGQFKERKMIRQNCSLDHDCDMMAIYWICLWWNSFLNKVGD